MKSQFDKFAYFNIQRCVRNKYIAGMKSSEHGAEELSRFYKYIYIRDSVHRNSRLKKSNEMEQSRLRKLAPQIIWSVPEAATTVLCTLDDGRDGRPKHVE